MPLTRHQAFVLARHALTESSWIVSFFTREDGKIRAVAKGGRQLKSPFRGALEPFNRVRVDIFSKESQELGNLRVADLEEEALDLFSDWGRSTVLFGALEVLERGLAERSPEEETWRLTGALLDGLRAGATPDLAWPWFLFWFLRLHGVLGIPKSCGACGASLGEGPAGGILFASVHERWVCRDCASLSGGDRVALPPGGLALLHQIQEAPLKSVPRSSKGTPALKGVADIVYLSVVGFLGRPLKAAPSIAGLYERR